MAVYRGPREKIERRFKEAVFGKGKALKSRSYPPGQHGLSLSRKKNSKYACQLIEKQKAKYTYGVLERQFRNLFYKATKKKGIVGEVLMQMLEMRLDNVVYRLGFASTRKAARQLVSHKHIMVNSSVVNIPSYSVAVGDVVGLVHKPYVRERIKGELKDNLDSMWLQLDSVNMIGRILSLPSRDQISERINERSIVELYSKF